jgi:hypothetical protein
VGRADCVMYVRGGGCGRRPKNGCMGGMVAERVMCRVSLSDV